MFLQDITRDSTAMSKPVMAAPSGITADALIETARGWLRADRLRVGDKVHTRDGGLRPVLGLTRDWLMPGQAEMVHIPGGSFDNCSALTLPEGQLVLVDTLHDVCLPDAMAALVPAAALAGGRGVTRQTIAEPVELITPFFADEEVIFGNSGVQLYCPSIGRPNSRCRSADFPQLSVTEGSALLARLRWMQNWMAA